MEERNSTYNLSIYIDNEFCDPIEDVSCPRSLTVSYESQNITLINTNHDLLGAVQLEVNLYIYECQRFIVQFLQNNQDRFCCVFTNGTFILL